MDEAMTEARLGEPMERPGFVKEKHLKYLDKLRESGVTNMFGARPYLMNAFRSLSGEQASAVLSYWMRTFSTRHPDETKKGRN